MASSVAWRRAASATAAAARLAASSAAASAGAAAVVPLLAPSPAAASVVGVAPDADPAAAAAAAAGAALAASAAAAASSEIEGGGVAMFGRTRAEKERRPSSGELRTMMRLQPVWAHDILGEPRRCMDGDARGVVARRHEGAREGLGRLGRGG